MIIGGTIIINQGIIPPKSSWYGKISTFMFYVSVVLVVAMAIFDFRNETLSLTILGVTAGMMIFALVNYAIIFFRIILITPFVALFIVGRYITMDYTPAIIVLVISGVSDFFDGFIARKFHQESELGKVLDPLADKLTLIAVGVCLICIEPYVLPLMIVMVIKSLLMTSFFCSLLIILSSKTSMRFPYPLTC